MSWLFSNYIPGGIGNAFTIFQTPFGTYPTASSSTDVFTFTSSDNSIAITGNSATDTIDFTLSAASGITQLTGDVTAGPGSGSVAATVASVGGASAASIASAVTASHAAVTIGTANGLSLSTQALSLQAADASHTGALTSTDWSTFNGKADAITGEYNAGNSSTSLALNFSNGPSQLVTMTGNCTFTISGCTAGRQYILRLLQDGTGGRTATWPAGVKWPGNNAPVLTVTGGQDDLIELYCVDSTHWRGTYAQNFTP